MLRTTTAPTIFNAGLKDNVIPSHARAVVNFRILPGDSIESVLAHVQDTVADPRVSVRPSAKRREPTPPSPADGEAWELLARSIREVFPGTVVSPYLMLAGTDSRHFQQLTDNVYRFMPLPLALEDTRRIHGIDERVSDRCLRQPRARLPPTARERDALGQCGERRLGESGRPRGATPDGSRTWRRTSPSS